MTYSDEYFMQQAYKEALKAAEDDEVPIGAVIVSQNRIIARAHNMTERLNDATAHAEMQAFTSAADYLGGKYLEDCTLYVTVEPCVMCAGAAFWTQIDRIVYGASDPKRGYTTVCSEQGTVNSKEKNLYSKRTSNKEKRTSLHILHPKTTVTKGIMEKECSQLLSNYFSKKRNLEHN